MQKPTRKNRVTFDTVHTHTHSVSGYLAYKKIIEENIKTHVLYMFFDDLENI